MDPLIKIGVALITGAGSGMGQAMAVKFAEHGCTKLFLVDVNHKGLEETQALVKQSSDSVKIVLHLTDVSVEAQVKEMVQTCVQSFGRIDFAMNNAGVAQGGLRTSETPTEVYDRLHRVNEKGVYLCEKFEIEQMLKQEPTSVFPPEQKDREIRGSIVNTCSLSGFGILSALSAYTSTKHAVLVMTRVDARQFAPNQIRVNCICPGYVPTPMMTSSGLTEEWLAGIKAGSPMNRTTYPEEVAESVVFLSGSRASGITGVNLSVDAGASLFHIH